MKLLFLSGFRGELLYGIELWMLRSGAALQKRGHQVTFMAREGSALAAGAGEHGLDTLPYPRNALALRRVLIERGIRVICLKSFADLRVAWWASRGLPVTLYDRRGGMGDLRNTLRHRLHIQGMKPAILVPSQALKTEFSRFRWVKSDSIDVLLHGIEVDPYAETEADPSKYAEVVFVGRLHPDKGSDVLLHAWKSVVETHPSARLNLVGDAGERSLYQDLVNELHLQDHVRFCGYQRDTRPWLASAEILVLPSRREGAGYVLLEAMAAGLAVVASNLAPIREYVDDPQTGLLVPPGEADPLAEALRTLLADPQRRKQMGVEGQRRAKETFSFSASMDRLERIWETA